MAVFVLYLHKKTLMPCTEQRNSICTTRKKQCFYRVWVLFEPVAVLIFKAFNGSFKAYPDSILKSESGAIPPMPKGRGFSHNTR